MTAPRPLPHPRPAKPARQPEPREPRSWRAALLAMCGVAGLLWVIQAINADDDYRLDRFGLEPRTVGGLWGVLTMPFLHASYDHLLSNTVPLIAIGWVLLLAGARTWALVTAIVVIGGGALTWLVGPSGTEIVGASAMVLGWLGYLLARAYFSRRLLWIVVAVLLLLFFGTLLAGLLPTFHSDVSWQAHVCGFAVGVGTGALLHPRRAPVS